MKVRVRCLCVEKLTLRIILRFKLVSVNCVSTRFSRLRSPTSSLFTLHALVGGWVGVAWVLGVGSG